MTCKNCEWFEPRDTGAYDLCHQGKGWPKHIADWTKGCKKFCEKQDDWPVEDNTEDLMINDIELFINRLKSSRPDAWKEIGFPYDAGVLVFKLAKRLGFDIKEIEALENNWGYW